MATCVPCKWCTQNHAMVVLYVCTVGPRGQRPGCGTPGWGKLSLPEAELRISSQPKPYRPVIAQVADDVFSQGLTRPPRCDLSPPRVGKRKHSRFPISAPHVGLMPWAGEESIGLCSGQRPVLQSSGSNGGEGTPSCCPERVQSSSPKGEMTTGPLPSRQGSKVTMAAPLLLTIPYSGKHCEKPLKVPQLESPASPESICYFPALHSPNPTMVPHRPGLCDRGLSGPPAG